MAEICPVCNKEITSENREVYKSSNDSGGIALHDYCLNNCFLEAEKSRDEICPVCNEDYNVRVDNVWYPISGKKVHTLCNNAFKQDLEHYGGVNADLDLNIASEEHAKRDEAERAEENFIDNIILEQAKIDEASLQEIKDKSVYIKDLDIPIKSMVIFMVKWALASIPAFIILAIIGAIFFAIFGSLFF